mgnify:CR=1 FL=1
MRGAPPVAGAPVPQELADARALVLAPGAAGQSQTTCNFGELMRRLQDTVEGRMSVEDLWANHAYEDCELGLRPACRLILLYGPSWS